MSYLNFPIETELAQKFWASKHKLNRVKAIIAFSLDEDNANDNLRRRGYFRAFRTRCIKNYKQYIKNPSMNGIPFSDNSVPWYIELKEFK